jgi:outer membrane protein
MKAARFLALFPLWAMAVGAGELEIRIDNPPSEGAVVAWLFDSPNTFVDLRDPARVVILSDRGNIPSKIKDLPAGEYALVVFHDANNNGAHGQKFHWNSTRRVGVFQPLLAGRAPPTFARAAFPLGRQRHQSDRCESYGPSSESWGCWGSVSVSSYKRVLTVGRTA